MEKNELNIKRLDDHTEIRAQVCGTNLLVVLYKKPKRVPYTVGNHDEWRTRHDEVQVSMNGKMNISFKDLKTLMEVVEDERNLLMNK